MSPNEHQPRPDLSPNLSEEEFRRWYWLKDELMAFARSLGIRATGSKELLADRVAAELGGRTFAEPEPERVAAGGTAQLREPVSAQTVIPRGQRCSQVIRYWFTGQVGSSFHFDGAMRHFFSATDGTDTLADALAFWHKSRSTSSTTIDAQFEYNRFTRAWHGENPTGTKEDLLVAWRTYRETPIDERGRA